MFGLSMLDLVWLLIGLLMIVGAMRTHGGNHWLWMLFTAMVLSIPIGRALQTFTTESNANADYVAAFAGVFVLLMVMSFIMWLFRPRKKKEKKAKGKAAKGGGHGGGHK